MDPYESANTEPPVAAFGYIIVNDPLSSREGHCADSEDHWGGNYHQHDNDPFSNPPCWMYPNRAADNDEAAFTSAADCTRSGSNVIESQLLENTNTAIYSLPDAHAGTVEMMDDTNLAALSGLTTATETRQQQQQQQQQRNVSYNNIRRNRRWKFLHHGIHTQTMVFDTPCTRSSTSGRGSGTSESTMLKLKHLNWGSDTRFRMDATTTSAGNRCRSSYYAVPKDQPTEAEATARILRNSAELIRDRSWIAQGRETASPSLPACIDDTDNNSNDDSNDNDNSSVTPPRSLKDQRKPRTRKRASAEPQTESQRRESHIRSEQVRRNLINSGFHELKMLVPGLRYQAYSKAQTLKVVCEWIEELVSGNEALSGALRGLEEEGQGNEW